MENQIKSRLESAISAVIERKDHTAALSICDEVLAENPVSDYAYRKRAWIYSDLGDLEKAVSDISVAIQLNSNQAEYYALRGRWYFDLGRFQQVILDQTTAIEIELANKSFYFLETAYFFRAASHLSLGHLSEAKADCKHVHDDFVIFTRTGRLSKEFIMSLVADVPLTDEDDA
ncbi:MAG: hypothetical protein IPJ30_23915 [Acidobacteria bacterium]|nr:hypothetical protein [Acidobacteriota bacterium]